jgi:hypothetical protein
MKPYPINPILRGFFLAIAGDVGVWVVYFSEEPSTKDPYPGIWIFYWGEVFKIAK